MQGELGPADRMVFDRKVGGQDIHTGPFIGDRPDMGLVSSDVGRIDNQQAAGWRQGIDQEIVDSRAIGRTHHGIEGTLAGDGVFNFSQAAG